MLLTLIAYQVRRANVIHDLRKLTLLHLKNNLSKIPTSQCLGKVWKRPILTYFGHFGLSWRILICFDAIFQLNFNSKKIFLAGIFGILTHFWAFLAHY